MNTTEINEPIMVGAVFSKSTVNPKWFIWKDNKRNIKEVTYTWMSDSGNAKLMHFAVTDGSTVYEISLNKKSLEWRLESTTTG